MFVDEITIKAKAGNGGDGVVRFRHEKFKPLAGPSGGNGGNGGDVYLRAVRDVNLLSKYTGAKEFEAESGESGSRDSRHGKNGHDLFIDVPVGSIIEVTEYGRRCELTRPDETVKILHGGRGGFGNESFKSSTNRAPKESTKGKKGEVSEVKIELSMVVDVGLIGKPNAGKSTLLNSITNASSKVGGYPFTTTEPNLGSLDGFVLADIPGLIEGASEGKGLGLKFLKHVTRAKMLLHLVSLEEENPLETYYATKKELTTYDKRLLDTEEWIVLSKKDLALEPHIEHFVSSIDTNKNRVFVISALTGEGVAELRDALVHKLTKA
jgi:GTP-binding protein